MAIWGTSAPCRGPDLDACHWPDSTFCVWVSSLSVSSNSLESEDQSKENTGEEETGKSPPRPGGTRFKRKWQAAVNLWGTAHHTWQREATRTGLRRTTKSLFCALRGCWPSFHLESWWGGGGEHGFLCWFTAYMCSSSYSQVQPVRQECPHPVILLEKNSVEKSSSIARLLPKGISTTILLVLLECEMLWLLIFDYGKFQMQKQKVDCNSHPKPRPLLQQLSTLCQSCFICLYFIPVPCVFEYSKSVPR